MELPSGFKFQGDKFSYNWLKEKLKEENFDVMTVMKKKGNCNCAFVKDNVRLNQ